MKLWLTRQQNGLYMLTHFKPTIKQIYGSNQEDVYIKAGEPIGIRNICNKILVLIRYPKDVGLMKRLESIQIELEASVITEFELEESIINEL